MIQQGFNLSEAHREKVIQFCRENQIIWSDDIIDSPRCGGVVGDPADIDKVKDYIKQLQNLKN